MAVTSSTTEKGDPHPDNVLYVLQGHRGYVPAGKLEVYHVVPTEEELRGQARPHKDS